MQGKENSAGEAEYQNFGKLRAKGLRISKGIDVRGVFKLGFEAPAQLNNGAMALYQGVSIGMYSYLRTGTIRYLRSIGRYCSIGPNVTIGESEHPTSWLSSSPAQYLHKQFDFYPPEAELAAKRIVRRVAGNHDCAGGNVVIGNDVWIGASAQIRRGVRIGDGAIIAGGAFVSKDVEPYTIVGGVPAKLIRPRFSDSTIERLLAVRWWRFDINDLAGVQFNDVEKALDQIIELEASGLIAEKPLCYSEIEVSNSGFRKS